MRIRKEFVTRKIAGEYILVPTGATSKEFNGMFQLTETGYYIWENIEKADSLDTLVSMICDEFEIDRDTAEKDTMFFLGKLLVYGFIEVSDKTKKW